jgi:hypothetical protein
MSRNVAPSPPSGKPGSRGGDRPQHPGEEMALSLRKALSVVQTFEVTSLPSLLWAKFRSAQPYHNSAPTFIPYTIYITFIQFFSIFLFLLFFFVAAELLSFHFDFSGD